MFLSRTMTAPTNLRSHVERVDTSRAMFMKYSSQDARFRGAGVFDMNTTITFCPTRAQRARRGRRLTKPLAPREHARGVGPQ